MKYVNEIQLMTTISKNATHCPEMFAMVDIRKKNQCNFVFFGKSQKNFIKDLAVNEEHFMRALQFKDLTFFQSIQ